MKKLKTNNNGRMPLWQADLEWMQQGFTEPLAALVAELGLSNGYFAISGCSPYLVGENRIAMDGGWFWWNGRILPVRRLNSTLTTSFNNPVVRLTLVTYADPRGARNFVLADQTTERVADVWQDDYLQPTVVERSASFPWGVRLAPGAWTLRDIIANHAAGGESDWIATSNGYLQYKRVGRLVVLRGIANADTAHNNPVATGLPFPLGGKVYISLPCAPQLPCRIDSAGAMYLVSNNGEELSFDGIMYMAATPYQAKDPNTINDNAATGDNNTEQR